MEKHKRGLGDGTSGGFLFALKSMWDKWGEENESAAIRERPTVGAA